MNNLRPDAVVRLRFLSTDDGGRSKPIPPGGVFGCPFLFEDEYFDCRLLLGDHTAAVLPGDTVDVALKFLCPDLIKPRLHQGSLFRLWEGRTIADGVVSRVVADEPAPTAG
jgi:hypothetical protein